MRFVVPESGDWTIDCAFESLRPVTAATTDVHVLVAGVKMFEAQVSAPYDPAASAALTYVDALTLAAGDTVDFVVGPGPSSNYSCDGTGLRARITKE